MALTCQECHIEIEYMVKASDRCGSQGFQEDGRRFCCHCIFKRALDRENRRDADPSRARPGDQARAWAFLRKSACVQCTFRANVRDPEFWNLTNAGKEQCRENLVKARQQRDEWKQMYEGAIRDKEQIAKAGEECQRKLEECQKLREKISKLEKDVKDADALNIKLQRERDEQRRRCDKAMEALKGRAEDLGQVFNDVYYELQEKKKEADDLRVKLFAKSKEADDLQGKVDDLQLSLDDCLRRHEMERKVFEAQSERIAMYEKQLSQLRKVLEKNLKSQKANLDPLEEAVQKALKDVDADKQLLPDFEEFLNDIKEFTRENTRAFQKTIDELEVKVRQLENGNKAALQDAAEKAQEAETLKEETKASQETIDKLLAEVQQLRVEKDEYRAERRELNALLKETETSWKEALVGMKTMGSKIQEYKTRLLELEDLVEKLNAEQAALQAELSDSKGNAEGAALQENDAKIKELEAQIEEMKKKLSDKDQEISNKDQEIDDLQAAAVEPEDDNDDEYFDPNDNSDSSAESVEEENESVSVENNPLKAEIEASVQKILNSGSSEKLKSFARAIQVRIEETSGDDTHLDQYKNALQKVSETEGLRVDIEEALSEKESSKESYSDQENESIQAIRNNFEEAIDVIDETAPDASDDKEENFNDKVTSFINAATAKTKNLKNYLENLQEIQPSVAEENEE